MSSITILHHLAFYTVIPTPILQNSLRLRVIAYIRKITLEFTLRYDLASDFDFQVIEVFGSETFYILNIYNEKERLATLPNQAQAEALGSTIVERAI